MLTCCLKWVNLLTSYKLKRQHSAEPLHRPSPSPVGDMAGSPISGTPVLGPSTTAEASSSTTKSPTDFSTESSIASPFKKQRASLPGFDDKVRKSLSQAILDAQNKERGGSEGNTPTLETKMEEDEEL